MRCSLGYPVSMLSLSNTASRCGSSFVPSTMPTKKKASSIMRSLKEELASSDIVAALQEEAVTANSLDKTDKEALALACEVQEIADLIPKEQVTAELPSLHWASDDCRDAIAIDDDDNLDPNETLRKRICWMIFSSMIDNVKRGLTHSYLCCMTRFIPRFGFFIFLGNTGFLSSYLEMLIQFNGPLYFTYNSSV